MKLLYIAPAILSIGVVSLGISTIDFDDYKTYDDLSVYEQRVEKFNEKYGTDYGIPYEPMTGTHQDIIDFYTSMTLRELDDYLLSLYDGSFYDTPQAKEGLKELPEDVKENAITWPLDDSLSGNETETGIN